MSQPWDQEYHHEARTRRTSRLNPKYIIKSMLTITFYTTFCYAAIAKHFYVNRTKR